MTTLHKYSLFRVNLSQSRSRAPRVSVTPRFCFANNCVRRTLAAAHTLVIAATLATAPSASAQDAPDPMAQFEAQMEEIRRQRDQMIQETRDSLGITDMMAATEAMQQRYSEGLPPPELVANRLWTQFQSVCGQAFEDPNAYLRTMPPPAPNGIPYAAASEDRAVTTVQVGRGGVIEDVEFVLTPAGFLTICVVHDLDINRALQLGIGSMDYSAVVAYNALLAEAVASVVRETDGAQILGGAVQIAPPDILEGEGLYSNFQAQMMWPTTHHRFGIVVPLAGKTHVAYAEVSAGATWIAVTRRQDIVN